MLLALLLLAATAMSPPRSSADRAIPAWLLPKAGTAARVDIAPWPTADEPEATLTQTAASLARDFSSDASRPGDIVYEPVGVRVRIVRVLAGRPIALVRAIGAAWQGYTLLDRLVPDVPRGTLLRAAGGFAGFTDFYAALATPQPNAERLATGSGLIVIGTGVAPYDPDSSDLVRLHVRVTSGTLRDRIGWLPASFTGLPLSSVPPDASVAARACTCRLVQFLTLQP